MISPLPHIMIEDLVRRTLLEDLGRAGDLTSDAVIP
jgi:nicotinate-nucleotide pyrophosphorylase (carboxylating)